MGGIIYDPGGKIVGSFAWGLGKKTNNEAKWLALMYGIELMPKRNIMLRPGKSQATTARDSPQSAFPTSP